MFVHWFTRLGKVNYSQAIRIFTILCLVNWLLVATVEIIRVDAFSMCYYDLIYILFINVFSPEEKKNIEDFEFS